MNDEVSGSTAVRTGVDSRSELKFADMTIARLGANTIFTLDEGTRTINLGSGAVLLRVPKDSGGAAIRTAAITGTTLIVEYHANHIFKFIMLEGTAKICQGAGSNGGGSGGGEECVDLGPGNMLGGIPGRPFAKPVTVDIKRLVETSQLLEGFGPLGSEKDLIANEIFDQLGSDGELPIADLRTGAVIDPPSTAARRFATSDPPPADNRRPAQSRR